MRSRVSAVHLTSSGKHSLTIRAIEAFGKLTSASLDIMNHSEPLMAGENNEGGVMITR